MTVREFRRWLTDHGCEFEEGKKHTKIIRGSRRSLLPRHPGKEVKTGTMRRILRDLGLKM